MSILSGLLGHASEIDASKLANEFSRVLVDGEAIESAFVVLRDTLVFTNKRLVRVDRQGLTGRKVSYLSIPYAELARFSVETAGTFDADAELRIWLRGTAEPLKQEFRCGDDIHAVHRALARHVLH